MELRLTILVVICGSIVGGNRLNIQQPNVPNSPCPELFYYYQDTHTSQILGALRIPPPQDSTKITVVVHLIVPVYRNFVRLSAFIYILKS